MMLVLEGSNHRLVEVQVLCNLIERALGLEVCAWPKDRRVRQASAVVVKGDR
jgi:hypothetical protein